MKTNRLVSILLVVLLVFSLVPLTALAEEPGITINLVEGEAIYFYLEDDALYVKSGDNAGQLCSGTVTLVGNNVTIPKIYAARDVGINNVTISGSNITILEGITASEGWGADYWANGNPGPTVSNLTITADNVTINGGINGGKGGDALYYSGKGGDVTGLTLAGDNITINGGINGGKGGKSYGGFNSNGGAVSNIAISGNNIVINGYISGGPAGDVDGGSAGMDGTVSGIQVVPGVGKVAVVSAGADSTSAEDAGVFYESADTFSVIAAKAYVKFEQKDCLATPEAVFTATGTDCGMLSNVAEDMLYSIDGGTTWTPFTGTSANLTDLAAGMVISIYRSSDDEATYDSNKQTLTLTQAAQPEGIAGVACSTTAQNDGKITGVDSTMEYKLSTASEWTAITGDALTGLANGTYEVRMAASGAVLASPSVTVTVDAHTCVAAGDWQDDGTNHYKLCNCGATLEIANHAGGTATCKDKAVCDVCEQPYGDLLTAHAYGEWFVSKKATTTEKGESKRVCSVCGHAETAEIPLAAEEDLTNPDTGDTSGVLFFSLLLVISGIGLAAIAVSKKLYKR